MCRRTRCPRKRAWRSCAISPIYAPGARRRTLLTLQAPHRPLSCAGLITRESRACARGLQLRYHGPHALRHAWRAPRLLGQGLSFKEIGDHLGIAADTTAIYAKVDLPSLRDVARFDLGGVR